MKNIEDWAANHNKCHPDDLCPHGVLLSDNAEEVSLWLQRYILGTCKTNGDKYPPRTLHLLLSGLQPYMRENKEHPFHFFPKIHLPLIILATVIIVNCVSKVWVLLLKKLRYLPGMTLINCGPVVR